MVYVTPKRKRDLRRQTRGGEESSFEWQEPIICLRKGDALEERLVVKNFQERTKKEIGET